MTSYHDLDGLVMLREGPGTDLNEAKEFNISTINNLFSEYFWEQYLRATIKNDMTSSISQ